MSNETEKTKTTGKGGVKVVIVIAAVVILALVGVIIWLVMSTSENKQEEKRNVITKSNAEQVAEEMINEEYVEPGYYSTQMSTEWHFETGNAVSKDAYVKNDASNTNDVYFDVFIEDDETTPIMESPLIPRGSELTDISLDKKLDAGTYNCVMVYHLVDDNQNSVSTLRVAFKIVVEK